MYTFYYSVLEYLMKGEIMSRPNRKRMYIEVPDQLYEDIKFCAKTRNITITRWVLRACYVKLQDERIIQERE